MHAMVIQTPLVWPAMSTMEDPYNNIIMSSLSIRHYCMKPPNIKAPKSTLLSIQCFIIQGQRSQALTGPATAHCEHRWGQLTLESPFRIVESG